MIGLVVNSVNTNDIDSEILELLDITLADIWFSERILVGSGTARLVVNTSEVESFIAGPEGC